MSPYISLFLAAVIGFICSFIASKKKRNPYLWFLSGFFFTVFALLILLLLPSKNQKIPSEADMKINKQEAIELEQTENSVEEEGYQKILDDKLWYYLDESNNQCGPMTLDALRNEWMEGKVKNTTFVWNEELPEWKPLQETSDFQEYFQKKS
ncbi:MAG: hypothetical protein COT84_08885 [Chlamydiae bacterium CG10_big_fil_rev_8_21_14_0_10_35_9]|nr:MAG: hypothetical protein COT84_08885 [Chlamydiae bacterium CG10_big_fil_rev_8_21_14_0_10_35_9]